MVNKGLVYNVWCLEKQNKIKQSNKNTPLPQQQQKRGILSSGNQTKVSQQGCAVHLPLWAWKCYWEESEEYSLFTRKY